MFSKEEIEKQVNDKRPLKPVSKRKAKEPTAPSTLVRLTAKRSGFTQTSVNEVITALMEVIQERLLDKKQVTLQGIGTLSPILGKARKATNFNRYNEEATGSLFIQPRFELRFFPHEGMEEDVRSIEVSAEEVEDMFLVK